MSRTYRGHYLNAEQQKLAADNLPLVWWYIEKRALRYGHICTKEIDDCAGYLIWHLCMAAEGFKPDFGCKFGTYAVRSLQCGLHRYKQLRDPYEEHYHLTDFSAKSEDGEHWGDIEESISDPEVAWEDVRFLFDFIEMDHNEKQITFFYYEQKYNLTKIAKMMGMCKERIRQINEEVIGKIKEAIIEHNIKIEDLIGVK